LAIPDSSVNGVPGEWSLEVDAPAQSISQGVAIISAQQAKGAKSMKIRSGIIGAIFLTVVLLSTAVVVAQQPQGPMPPRTPPPDRANPPNAPNSPNPSNPPNPDPLADVVFPPELILGHARELKLTDEQKTFMRAEIQRTTNSFTELQWKLQDEMEVLHETLKSTAVDEQQALAELNKVLDIEREIKRLHIGLAVRLKNRLTPDQQEQLQRMRMAHMRMVPGPDVPMQP
jgi:Spy/CpxP family protein refolding chaperone